MLPRISQTDPNCQGLVVQSCSNSHFGKGPIADSLSSKYKLHPKCYFWLLTVIESLYFGQLETYFPKDEKTFEQCGSESLHLMCWKSTEMRVFDLNNHFWSHIFDFIFPYFEVILSQKFSFWLIFIASDVKYPILIVPIFLSHSQETKKYFSTIFWYSSE